MKQFESPLKKLDKCLGQSLEIVKGKDSALVNFFRQTLLDFKLTTAVEYWERVLLQHRQRLNLHAIQRRLRTTQLSQCAPLLPRTLQTSPVKLILWQRKNLPFFSGNQRRSKIDKQCIPCCCVYGSNPKKECSRGVANTWAISRPIASLPWRR